MSASASWRFDKVNSSTAEKRKPVMSAMPRIATDSMGRFELSPSAISRYQHFSLDHLVGAGDERPGNFKPKRLGGAEVDEQFDFRGLLDINLTRCLKANPAPRNRSARRGLGELGIEARVSPSPFHRANQAALYHQTGSSSACSAGR
jgi:hypothetical protein